MNHMQWDKVKKWKRWATAMHDEVSDLVLRRFVWRELVKMIEANPKIQKPSLYYEWLPVLYTHTQVMAIRRIVDRHKDARSLAKLVKEIHDDWETAQAYADETPLVIGSDQLDKDVPDACDDLLRIRRVTEPVHEFADKRIAHRDGHGPKRLPKYRELDDAINLLEEIAIRYYGFLYNVRREVEPTIAYPWDAIFTVPWIPSEQQ